jgi:ATP:cob(I)alamin adenosyltransferase
MVGLQIGACVVVDWPSAASTALARIRHEPAQALGKHTPIVHGLVLSRLPLLMFAHSPLNLKLRVLPEALLDARVLRRVQHSLFNLGSILATLPEDVHPRQPRVRQSDVDMLEAEMDRCNGHLEPLRSFVLPGGSRLNTDLHLCRTVCRRVERLLCQLAEHEEVDPLCIAYVNRLSDAFFVWCRWANHLAGSPEELWAPNAADEAIDP